MKATEIHTGRPVTLEGIDDRTHLFANRSGAPAKGEVGVALCGMRARRKLGRAQRGPYRGDHCQLCVLVDLRQRESGGAN